MYGRVLVALDGSVLAEQAISQAERVVAPGGLITLARAVDSALVVPSAGSVDYASLRGSQELADHVRRGIDRPRAEAASYLEEARRKVTRTDVTVVTRVLEGNPVDRLLEAAREFDLVVLSTRGRGGLAWLLLGGVAEHVVRHAPVPVLVIREWATAGDT
jgi:nucleotide-binding universal stress UspA family protein